MIRKISHIIITSLLLVLTMGFTVSRHYCGGSIVDVSVFAGHTVSCSDDGSACEMDGCCHNEQEVYQLHEDYTSPLVIEHVPFIQVDLAVLDLCLITPDLSEADQKNSFSEAESPPPKEITAVLSALQVYRL